MRRPAQFEQLLKMKLEPGELQTGSSACRRRTNNSAQFQRDQLKSQQRDVLQQSTNNCPDAFLQLTHEDDGPTAAAFMVLQHS